MTKKVNTPAGGSAQTIYYETNDDNTVVKFSAGGRTVTSHSGTDSFGRKVFDELQLGTDFVSRQFVPAYPCCLRICCGLRKQGDATSSCLNDGGGDTEN